MSHDWGGFEGKTDNQKGRSKMNDLFGSWQILSIRPIAGSDKLYIKAY